MYAHYWIAINAAMYNNFQLALTNVIQQLEHTLQISAKRQQESPNVDSANGLLRNMLLRMHSNLLRYWKSRVKHVRDRFVGSPKNAFIVIISFYACVLINRWRNTTGLIDGNLCYILRFLLVLWIGSGRKAKWYLLHGEEQHSYHGLIDCINPN